MILLLLQSSTASTTTAPANRTPMDDMTTFTLILIAVLAAVVIVAMVVGMRLKRRRQAGIAEFEREEEAELERRRSGQVVAPPPITPTMDEPQPAVPAAVPLDQGLSPAGAVPKRTADGASSPEPVAPSIPSATTPQTDTAALVQLKGLGPKVAAMMADAGVTSLAQLAALSPGEQAALDARLGSFQGRMARDRWVEQARLLASGDRAGYETAFGKLG